MKKRLPHVALLAARRSLLGGSATMKSSPGYSASLATTASTTGTCRSCLAIGSSVSCPESWSASPCGSSVRAWV